MRCFSLNSLDDLPDLPESEENTSDDSQTSLFESQSDNDNNLPDSAVDIIKDDDEKEDG